MAWRVLSETDGADEALEAELAAADVPWDVGLLRWAGGEGQAALDEALRAGAGVVVLVADDAEERAALDAGATEVARWPGDAKLLAARVKRAARVARLPFLERMFDELDHAVELTTSEVEVLDVNEAFERGTGLSKSDVLGRTTAELFRSETQDPEYYAQIGEALSKGEAWRGQFTAKRLDGSLSFQSVVIAPALDATGRLVGHVAVKRDTSRDNLAFSALESAETRTRTMFDEGGAAVFVHDFEGRAADVNAAACKMLEVERAELLDLDLREVFSDRSPDDVVAFWGDVGGEPRTIEALWKTGDDLVIAVELAVVRTKISGTELLLTTARDVSERMAARRRLEVLNTYLEEQVAARTDQLKATLAQRAAVLDNLVGGLLAVDDEGRVEVINPRLEGMFPGVGAHWLGEPLAELDSNLWELFEASLERGIDVERQLPIFDDGVGRAVVSPIDLEDERGERRRVGAVMLCHDVTLAAEIDRMKTEFIATVSHELRTPLTSVLGFAKLARGKLDKRVAPAVDPDAKRAQTALTQVSENLEIIVREGKRLSELIDDVLDIAKMEAGRVEWHIEPIKPAELVEQAIEVTSGLFTQTEVQRVKQIAEDLPELEGDRARLLQVVINLISNAAKFTVAGEVRIGAGREGDRVQFWVEDTGVGVPIEERETIFEKFRQARDTLTDKPKGTGLGLPICKHIVEHHGGRIWVEDAAGVGSRFVFDLPEKSVLRSATPSMHPAHEVLRHVERTSETALEILVVDDDAAVRELLRQLLEEAGHSVRLASDGVGAVTAVRERAPDLLILDVLMPGISGFDVAALLRSDPSTRGLPIVVLSVVADPQRSANLGVDRHLTKPLKQDELLEAISEIAAKLEGGDHEHTWVLMRRDEGAS